MAIQLVHTSADGEVTTRNIVPMNLWGNEIAFLETLVRLLVAMGAIKEPHELPTQTLNWALQPVDPSSSLDAS